MHEKLRSFCHASSGGRGWNVARSTANIVVVKLVNSVITFMHTTDHTRTTTLCIPPLVSVAKLETRLRAEWQKVRGRCQIWCALFRSDVMIVEEASRRNERRKDRHPLWAEAKHANKEARRFSNRCYGGFIWPENSRGTRKTII